MTILSIDPGTRYIGVAVMRNNQPIFFRTKTIKTNQSVSKRIKEAKMIIQRLISYYQPEILAIEKPKPHWIKQSKLLDKIIKAIKETAKANKMKVREFTPEQVRKAICGNPKATKSEMLQVLLQKYPDLSKFFHKSRIKNRYWHHLFDAIALGVAVCSKYKILNELPRSKLTRH